MLGAASNRYRCNDSFVDSVLFSGCGGVVGARICNPPRLHAEEVAGGGNDDALSVGGGRGEGYDLQVFFVADSRVTMFSFFSSIYFRNVQLQSMYSSLLRRRMTWAWKTLLHPAAIPA
jgi:hypothetical protein